ncbi:MAG: hypothetical protein EOM20_15015 [Spartobacteria bacterium]|nr:hypothetical protein [Spartobacteria bacterium]
MTGLLRACGFSLGTHHQVLDAPGEHNAMGHFENAGALMLNQLVLHTAGGNWIRVPEMEQIMRAGVEYEGYFKGFERAFNGDIFKDPRTMITWPLWEKYCASLDRAVLCLRHPRAVTQSLNRRHNLPEQVGLSLWYTYNLRFIEAVKRVHVSVVDYDQLCAYPREVLTALLTDLSYPCLASVVEKVSHDFVRRGLNHTPFDESMLDGLPEPVVVLYSQVKSAALCGMACI